MSAANALRKLQAPRAVAIQDELKFRKKSKERGLVEARDVPTPMSSDVHQHNVKGYQRPVFPGMEEIEKQQIGHRRYKILKDVRDMARNDPRVSRMLYKLAADAAYKSFSVIIENAPGKRIETQALDIINRTRFLINDKKHLRGWIEALLRDGDLFLQLLVGNQPGPREILRVKKLAAEMTFSRLDAEGEFPKDKSPYYQAHVYDVENEIRSFDAWEIVHVKWRGEDGMPYGRPVFESARLAWQRVDSGEKNVTVRRQLRAGRRIMFNVGTEENPGTWEDVEKFKVENRDALENPQNPVTDFFGNGQVSAEEIEGDQSLQEIKDIQHFEGLLHICGFTSQANMSGGRESTSNYAVIDSQEEDYLRTLGHIDESIEEGFRQIFDLALLLKMVNPSSIDYVLNWGAKDRNSLDKKLLRCGLLIECGFSHQTAFEIADLDNGVTYEQELERIRKQLREGDIPYSGPLITRGLSSAKKEEEDKIRLGDGK